MNLILFFIFVIGIICMMSGYYSDKILKDSNTKIEYIPRPSKFGGKLNTGSNLHNFYTEMFFKPGKWSMYPYGSPEYKPGIFKPPPISPDDFINNSNWPTFMNSKDYWAPVDNTLQQRQQCKQKCFQDFHIHEKPEGKHRNSKLVLCKEKCNKFL